MDPYKEFERKEEIKEYKSTLKIAPFVLLFFYIVGNVILPYLADNLFILPFLVPFVWIMILRIK